jgi:hypothetical protein
MEELMLILAGAMPFEQLVESLRLDIEKYQQNPIEENKKGIEFYCFMLISKGAVNAKGYDQVMKDFEDIKEAKKVVDRMNNLSDA